MYVFGKLFYSSIISFLAGVIFHSMFLPLSLGNTTLFVLLACGATFYLFGNQLIKIIGLILVFFLLGFIRFDTSIDIQQKHSLDYFALEAIEITLEGKITERPIIENSKQSVVVDVDSLVLGDKIEAVDTNMIVRSYEALELEYGQSIRFKTIPQKPSSFDADGGRIFDYEHFLEKDGIYYSGQGSDIEITQPAPRTLISRLYDLKSVLLDEIFKSVPKPESSLLAGVLLGEKTALGDELEEDFRTTGIMHIVVLSGYNVSLVIVAVMIMLAWLPLYSRSIIAVVGIVLFALLVGAGPTVIRASIMALFIVLAKVLGKDYHIERALLFAAALMVMYNPWVLYFDISFQFSFLATYGLIALSPWLEEKLAFIPKTLMLRDSAVATIAAQIMVAPLILYYIGDFSFVSIVVNMLVLFMVPISMLLGFVVAVMSSFTPFIATLLAVPLSISLSYILWIVEFFADIPFAKISINMFSWWWLIPWYLFIFYLVHKDLKN